MATRTRRERKRLRDTEIATYDEPAVSMVAAAVGVKAGHSFQNLKLGGTDWQQEGWLHYDSTPEFHAAVQIIAFNLSRARLYGVDVDPVSGQASTEPTADPDVADIMAQFFGGPAGQSQALDRLGRHLTVAGDTWVLATDDPDQDEAAWQILASTEVTGTQGRVLVQELNGQHREVDFDRELLMRIWRPHPKRRQEADAVTRSLLPVLRELAALSAMVSGTIKSRLASSGILWLPEDLTLPAPADPSTDDGVARSTSMGADGWLELITEAMTAPIKDPDSAAAVVPLVAVVNAASIEKIKHMEFGRDLDSVVEPLRQAGIKRLAVGMDMPPEVLLGMGPTNHWCVDDETEVLTTEGWRGHGEVGPGTLVLTLNHSTGLSEWQPVLDMYRADVVDEPMLRMETATHSSLTTPNHRWPTLRQRHTSYAAYIDRQFKVTAGLDHADRIVSGAACADTPTVAEYTDDLVELVAWYWTEGSRGGNLTVAQSHTRNPERVARIRTALTRTFGPALTRLVGADQPAWLEVIQPNLSSHGGPITVFRLNKAAAEPFDTIAPGKRVTPDFIRSLTPAQLELFIDISCQGDGWHYRAGRLDIWQREQGSLDAFELALILSGRSLTWTASGGGHCITPRRHANVRPLKSTTSVSKPMATRYSGTIWCPVTANSTWFARRKGTVYYTGNTSWSISETFAKAFLSPLLELIVDAATHFYLRRALLAIGRDPALFAVGFDLSALFPRQMSVDNAQAAYDAGLLSEEAYMAALGFGPAEMASKDERARRIVQDMVKRGLAQTIQELAPALHALYPGLVVAPLVGPVRHTTTENISEERAAGTEPTPAATNPAPPARPALNPPPAGGQR